MSLSPELQSESDELARQLHAEILLATTRIAHIRATANANAYSLLIARIEAECS